MLDCIPSGVVLFQKITFADKWHMFVMIHISSYDSIKSVEALKHLRALTQSSVLPCAGSEYCTIDSLVDFGAVS